MASNREDFVKKVDEDLDEFVAKMIEKNKNYRYTDTLHEDKWQEEIENIPLFMTKSPENIGDDCSPAIEALQALKYEDEDPKAQALSYKEDGNEEFKKENYKKAISVYTEGIRIKCDDPKIMSTLFANRANAHFKIGNYRSSLHDARTAKNIQSGYVKAIFRGACACLELECYEEAIVWCNEGLLYDSSKTFQDLLKKASLKKKQQERDRRKAKIKENKTNLKKTRLVEAIMSRGLKVSSFEKESDEDDESDDKQLTSLNLNNGGEVTSRVFLDDNNILHWPVVFIYPEYGQSDFIEAFNENTSFSEHINVMFGNERAPWDIEQKYKPSQLEICFEDVENQSLVSIDQSSTLLQSLRHPRYTIFGGIPSFIILVKHTPFQREFKAKYKLKK